MRRKQQLISPGILLLALLYLIITSLPYWSGYWHCPPGAVFIGHPEPYDSNVLFSIMQGGANLNKPLFINLLTTEPHRPFVFYPLYPILGWLARSLNLEPLVIFNLVRACLCLLFVFSSFWLTKIFFPNRTKQTFALLLLLFSGGWGNWFIAESLPIMGVSFFPQFTLALITHELFIIALLSSSMSRFWRVIIAACSGLLLTFNHPFTLLPLVVISISYLILIWLYYRQKFITRLIVVSSFMVGAFFPALYYIIITKHNFVIKVLNYQNVMIMEEGVISWLRLLNISLVGALFTLPFLFIYKKPHRLFILVWVVIGSLCLLTPVSFNRRLVEGLPLGLSIAITELLWLFILPALLRLLRKNRRFTHRYWNKVKILVLISIFVLLAPRTFTFLRHFTLKIYSPPNTHYYITSAEYSALQWLKAQPNWEDAVWCSLYRGNSIPRFTAHRTFIGHSAYTLFATEKLQLTNQLFEAVLDEDQLRDILQKHRIKYIYAGRIERDIYGKQVINNLQTRYKFLTPIFANAEVLILTPRD